MNGKMTLDKLAGITMNAFKAVDERFDAIDKRFESIDKRFEAIDRRFDLVDARLNGIDGRLDYHASNYVSYPEYFKLTKRVEKLEKKRP